VGGAFLIGSISLVVCYLAATKLKHKFNYDDSLDVFGVHGVGGIVGALLTGLFIREGYDGAAGVGLQFWVQAKNVLVTAVWSALTACIAIITAKVLCKGLRVDTDAEHGGLDHNDHGEEAYGSDS
jgi:ammonium transporter, Amt family